ncbi:MAG: conjugal transfer protein TraG N-terminal domain-containing protein [Tatlockia sp.]|nr:conjugal transfer protein TraG N-terminal domain-containing protein [Tatlockia sp.]
MVVFSPLSLYTTYLGWQQYEVLFDALWQTGILYLGFLMVCFRYLKKVLAPAGSTHHAAEHALNHFLYELAVTFLICAIFVYPCVNFEQKGLKFKPLCTFKKSETIKESTLKDTGTTYDETFADVLTDKIKIPLGFSLIQNFSSSLTYGLMKVTGCSDSLQAIQGDLISTYIPTDLRKQALQFHRQCFLEARTTYLNETLTDANKTKVADILKHHGGEEDLTWLGSKTFKTLYYSKLRAREPVAGFPYESYPNPNFTSAEQTDKTLKDHRPADGYPTCSQWWTKLQKDLVNTTKKAGYFEDHIGSKNVAERVFAYQVKHKLGWNSNLTSDDYIAKVLLHDSKDMQVKSAEALINPTNNDAGTFVSRSLVNIGQSVKSWTITPLKREAIMQTLPVMHAFFYFFLIVFTIIVLALSGYSPRALGSLCALYFMSIFIQCIWHYASFLETAAVDALGDSEVVASIRNIALLIYFIAPLLLLKLSSHFGGEGGASLGALMSTADNAAKESAQSGMHTAKAGVKVVSGGRL